MSTIINPYRFSSVPIGAKMVLLHNVTTPTPYLSSNLGDSFTTGTAISTCDGTIPYNLKIAPDDLNKMIMARNTSAADNIIFDSTNGGSTWSANATINTYLWDTAISRDGSAKFVARYLANGILYYSYSNNSSFSSYTYTSGTVRAVGINSDGSTVYIVNYTSTAGKKSTNSCGSFSDYTQPYNCNSVFVTNDAGIIFVAPYNYSSNVISYSTNGGTNWTTVTLESASGAYGVIRASYTGQYILLCTYANTTQKVWVSNNYGQSGSWTQKLTGYTDMNYNAANVSNSGKYMIVGSGGTNGRFFISDDFGANWTVKNTGQAYIVTGVGIQDN